MFLNLNDVNSIIDWWQVFPERHSSYLEYKLRVSPEFAPAIREAQRHIAGSAELSALLSASVNASRAREALEAERKGRLSSLELRHRELALAA